MSDRKTFWVYETDRLSEVSRSVWPNRKNPHDYDREFRLVELRPGEIVIQETELERYKQTLKNLRLYLGEDRWRELFGEVK